MYREPDYKRHGDNEEYWHRIKAYGHSDTIANVALARGLRCERVSLPAWDFVVVKVFATKAQFKAAQYEWLQQMIATQPRAKKPIEIDLFV